MAAMQPPAKRCRTEDLDGAGPVIPCTPGEALAATPAMLRRMLDVIELEVLPKTERGVALGNKVFGAAILDARASSEAASSSLLPTVIAETNHETLCPLYHGEVYTIKQWSESLPPDKRPCPAESLFLSTHEPCCMCISAIVWAGFKKVFYLFPYESTRDQGIPHDIDIMQELWQVPRYAQRNKFCSLAGLLDLIAGCPPEDQVEFSETVDRITSRYEVLARRYHAEKSSNPKNTLAFD
ncbi:unnamed protein product [Polarella glacialis]|uniref:CMP/dCMP-type deaminase domain-containing protein n=1 Tax=Polarella glacialis TaxID=89957 RepID=A0A813KGD0_POLGL|nr:unnamed protein product [Polarella glacialis]CAE8699283.1 unnamed protein product [Polarella glacialis]